MRKLRTTAPIVMVPAEGFERAVAFYLLGVHPKDAFPIMMGSCAVLMPVASARFIKDGRYSPRAALDLTLGGIPAVLIAAFVVKSLPLEAVRSLVVIVVLYTAVGLVRASRRALPAAAVP